MADSPDTRIASAIPQNPSGQETIGSILRRLRNAGVEPELVRDVSDLYFKERAKAMGEAAKLFRIRQGDDERLSDLQHADELNRIKARCHGLLAAIDGAFSHFESADHGGVCQLGDDVCEAVERCAEAFEAERQLRMGEERR
ncbi:MAG: hypothetical protein HYS06_09385 [Methylocystis sp.]|nr:hypothetical protein [Methylocystis sp.]